MTRGEKLLAKLEAMKQASAEFDAKMAEFDRELEVAKAKLHHIEERGRETDAILKEWGEALEGAEY